MRDLGKPLAPTFGGGKRGKAKGKKKSGKAQKCNMVGGKKECGPVKTFFKSLGGLAIAGGVVAGALAAEKGLKK
jgi:hypothetical protein